MQQYFQDEHDPAAAPVIVVKHMLFCFLEGIKQGSLTEEHLQTNMAYRWFLGFNITGPMPSTGEINRVRQDICGPDVWDALMERALQQCAEHGLPHERGSAWLYDEK